MCCWPATTAEGLYYKFHFFSFLFFFFRLLLKFSRTSEHNMSSNFIILSSRFVFFLFSPYSLNIILSSFFSFFSILMQTQIKLAHLHYTKCFPQSCLLSSISLFLFFMFILVHTGKEKKGKKGGVVVVVDGWVRFAHGCHALA